MQQRREWRSFQPSRCRFLAIVTFMALVDEVSAGNKARGIDPQDGWSLDLDEVLETELDYFKDGTIWCKDGLKSFPRERLNDNFCDCADGTDEPGTPACPNGKYYCKNVGSDPRLVHSSRVNDGICDCCDGSDEYEKRVDCANTCGGAITELSERLEADLGQSTTLDTLYISEVFPDEEQKKFQEDRNWREMKAFMLVTQWLPLFSLLALFGWIWAGMPRRLPFRQKKVSRSTVV